MCSADGKMIDGLLAHPHRRRVRWWAAGVAAALVVALVLGVLVQRATWAGPAFANGLRALLGDRAVARLEEVVASVQDRAMRALHRHDRPRQLDQALPERAPRSTASPPVHASAPGARAGSPDGGASLADAGPPPRPPPSRLAFEIADVTPPFAEVAAAHDGQWAPLADPERPDEPAVMAKTLIHPDPERSYAEVFVVAMPTSAIEVRLVAGTEEPESDTPDVARLEPRGFIAPGDERGLLAAFNGGFRARHGHHGMLTGGVSLLPLRAELCTISAGGGGALAIGSWHARDEVSP
ncbi:MAG TPA: hypothetical protein VMG12_05250, partial [Polyangiaceae bacterium]|nr:hypothetical protein [Polyangiaceae bacterium]